MEICIGTAYWLDTFLRMFVSVHKLGKQEEKTREKRVSPILTVLRMYSSPPSLSLSLCLSVAMEYGLNETGLHPVVQFWLPRFSKSFFEMDEHPRISDRQGLETRENEADAPVGPS